MAYFPLSSSPYQNVPSTPQARARSILYRSPLAIVPQLPTLYSSPSPPYNSFEYIDDDFPESPTSPFYIRPRDTFDNLLISESAATARVEQVVPASPVATRTQTQESSSRVIREPLQIPFRIDSLTSMTPKITVSSYLTESQELADITSPLILSQDESPISLPTYSQTSSSYQTSNIRHTSQHSSDNFTDEFRSTLQEMNDHESSSSQLRYSQSPIRTHNYSSRPNVRHTPRRGIDRFTDRLRTPSSRQDGQFSQLDHETYRTPRRLNNLLQRQSTPYMSNFPAANRNITEFDLFNREEIFG